MSPLPRGWEERELAEIARDITYGYTAKSNATTGTARMLRITDIQDNKVEWEQVPFCEISESEKAKYLLKKWDLVFARTGATVGKSFLIRDDVSNAVFASYLIRVRLLENSMARYLGYFFKSPRYWQQVTEFSAGIGQPNVNGSKLKNLRVPVAPLAEQKRIADKLDSLLPRVDACRERLDQVSLILKRFRQSVLAAAMTGKLSSKLCTQRRSSDDSKDLKVWKNTDIQSIAMVSTGSTPLRSNSAFYASTGTPWITSSATGKPYVTEATEYVTTAAIKEHRLKLYPVGTLLVAMYGEGKTRGQVTELAIEATINQACAAIVVDETKAVRAFVKLALQANYLEMREMAEGGNQPNLNLSKIKEFKLLLPSIEEQRQIVNEVDVLFDFSDRLETRVALARDAIDRLTPSLLAKAFRGALVPQDPNDEPATELLKRLAATASGQPEAKRSRRVTKVRAA